MYDIIIIGAGASGLFTAGLLPSESKKLILEKTNTPGQKVLLSGGGRCNFSNTNATGPEHYHGNNLQGLHKFFNHFGPNEMIDILNRNNISSKEENNGRIILTSNKSKQLSDFLVNQAIQNGTEILYNQEVLSCTKKDDYFIIKTDKGTFQGSKIIVSTGGTSFPQIGATGIGRKIAQDFGIKVNLTYPALCGIETKEDNSILTGNSIQCKLEAKLNNKIIYQTQGALLFTHRGISGPLVFDTTLRLGNQNLEKIQLDIYPDLSQTIKKIIKHFDLDKKPYFSLHIKSYRPNTEAKVTGGGIPLSELKPSFESKKISGLYFIGELLDVTGETGGYNLQRCRTSAYICSMTSKEV